MKIKDTLIEKRTYVGKPNDYVVYEEFFKLETTNNTYVLRIKFNTDSSNSFGLVCYKLSSKGWEELYTIHKTQTNVMDVYKGNVNNINLFTKDVEHCKEVVKKILF